MALLRTLRLHGKGIISPTFLTFRRRTDQRSPLGDTHSVRCRASKQQLREARDTAVSSISSWQINAYGVPRSRIQHLRRRRLRICKRLRRGVARTPPSLADAQLQDRAWSACIRLSAANELSTARSKECRISPLLNRASEMVP